MRRLLLPLALALPACAGTPTIKAPRAAEVATPPAEPPTSSTSISTTSSSTTTSTPSTTTTAVAPPKPEPVVSPHSAAGGPGRGETVRVSWYGSESGSVTASGEPYNPDAMTFAHKTMPFGTLIEFCGPHGCVIARCTDRGPFVAGRTFDLSRAAFAAIAPLRMGVAEVTWSYHG